MKLLKGKRLKSVTLARNQPCFCWAYFLVNGSASILTIGKSSEECGIFGCVIASVRIQWLGLRISARRKAGFRPRSCLGCWHNGFNRPVLKHGPRSLTCLRVFGWKTRTRNESDEVWLRAHPLVGTGTLRRAGALPTDLLPSVAVGLSWSSPVRTRKMVNYA